MTTRQKIRDSLNRQLETIQNQLALLETIPGLDDVTVNASFFGSTKIDFDNLTHPEIIEVIKATKSTWKKELNSDATRIDYETKIGEVTLRCWAGEPPPNCKVIDVVETIPPQPERTIIRRKLVCS